MTVDLRTRVDSEQEQVEAGRFFRETLPPLLDVHQAEIAPGASELPLDDFCIETDGEPWTLGWRGERVELKQGRHGKARVRLTEYGLAHGDRIARILLGKRQFIAAREMPCQVMQR
jgi:hypothetical protein